MMRIFFLFGLDLKLLIDKPGFCECVETRSFFILANNSRSQQNEAVLPNYQKISPYKSVLY